jgi:YegS/Rv2252/BmrU family lipid kinase
VAICVIFNPFARGEKARHFRRHLDLIAGNCALKQTAAAGGGRPLAAEAIREGFETIVAAGGDGTLNEVLNGIGDAPGGFKRARLGVIPLGTVNVFAKEIGIPQSLKGAWKIITAGNETRIDLPCAEFLENDKPARRYFAQLAGSGLDSRAIELVDFELKKKIGPLAYIVAGIQAIGTRHPLVRVRNGSESASGELVMIGNGRFYGGKFPVHGTASMKDGEIDVLALHRTDWLSLLRCAGTFFAGWPPPGGVAKSFRTKTFTLDCDKKTPLELDGENIGFLPATFTVQKEILRVVIP